MLRGMVKSDVKKDVCHFELVIEVLILYIFLKNNPQIPTMLELTKAQQSSTSKATTSKLKDRFPRNKYPLRLFNRSPISKDESRTGKA
jgi:F0F1-type ATP synthase membrane subunit a